MFEPYKPPAAAVLPARFKEADGYWTAIADDPLVFMANQKFLTENKLSPPTSWDDLLIGLQKHASDGGRAHVGYRRNPHLLGAGGERPR